MRFVRLSVWPAASLMLLLMMPDRANAQNSVAFYPGVGALPDGVSLNVTPAVSADRRYVRLSLAPQFQTINGFSTFPVPAAVGGGGNGGGGLGGLGGGGLAGLGGGGLAGGGLRSIGVGRPDFANWYPDLGVPRAQSSEPLKPSKATASRSKKPLPDPEIVPMKKKTK